jgi:hypothetical protein
MKSLSQTRRSLLSGSKKGIRSAEEEQEQEHLEQQQAQETEQQGHAAKWFRQGGGH